MKTTSPTKFLILFFLVLTTHFAVQAQINFDTPGPHSYPVPASGVAAIKVEVWGAGGAGANTSSNSYGAGGGGGAYATRTLAVTPGQTFNVVVGAGGNGSSTATAAARNGGVSEFDTTGGVHYVIAAGGKGALASGLAGGEGGLASASGGHLKLSGGNGGDGATSGAMLSGGGGGAGGTNGAGGAGASASNGGAGGVANAGDASTPSGNGGNGVHATGQGYAGLDYGGGGAGGAGANQNGGNGAPGLVRITELASSVPEIRISGLGIKINSGNTPTTTDNTDFGIGFVGQDVERVFTISNMGSATLDNISFTHGSGDSEFRVKSSSSTPLPDGTNTTFTLLFNPSRDGVFNAVIYIQTNDPNLPQFELHVTGVGRYVYYDSDGDGVKDNIDLDDDNDGIYDTEEEKACPPGTICDTDGDGVPDVYDLDSDNDGIPDVVEAGLGADSDGTGVLQGSADADGLMTNAGVTPLDSDNDGIPDYRDLDSDNDGVFDVDEYGIGNQNDPAFQNGDGDISGDGVGDGPESETFREQDLDNNSMPDAVGFGDGILDIFDFHTATTNQDYTNSYGNVDQGTASPYELDTDNDGFADYRDPVTGSVNDFTKIEILDPALFDLNTGVLLDGTDADGDGIMDSRDGDATVFGSPRNLNDSYSLYFDGRNDYVEEPEFLNGIDEGTMMCWVKLDVGVNDAEFIVGQENINFAYRAGRIIADVNGTELVGITQNHNGKWMHLALTYSVSINKSVFYVNGEHVGDNSASGLNSLGTGFLIGRTPAGLSSFFQGEIDEVRVFNRALTETEVKRMVYQELDDTNKFNRGKIIPLEIASDFETSLIRYYKMDHYEDDKLIDISGGNPTGATIYNAKDILFQTAPLPYVTAMDGDWTNEAVWKHGDVWDISDKKDNPDDAAIIQVNHHIETSETEGTLGIILPFGTKITVNNPKGLYNNWYTKLDGILDIEGESQFIQTEESVLDVNSGGYLEIDQQGTKDLYTYNYWGSPVGKRILGSINNSFILTDVLYDGTIASNTSKDKVLFTSSGYNGSPGTPITLANYWIDKFVNGQADNYYAWHRIGSTGTIDVGEGFTMKGSDNTATSFNETQNYSFRGKPNNGDITLTVSAGNQYLIGNPYPSAIDARAFILDNITSANSDPNGGAPGTNSKNVINGALYFWDHFANKTHTLREYEGGYAVYNLMGDTYAVSDDPLINASGNYTGKTPGRFIPVAQGFFVSATLDSDLTGGPIDPTLSGAIEGGDIIFKNSQRVFETEFGGNSVFFKEGTTKKSAQTTSANTDTREKIKLRFESSTGVNRQLLVGVDSLASSGFNIGYDAPLIEDFSEDMYWYFLNSKFIIQGTDSFDESVVLPLGVKVAHQGLVSISIDSLQNIDVAKNIYLHDKVKDVYHDMRVSDYEVNLSAGEYLDRFALTFSKQGVLATQEELEANFGITYVNNEKALIIKNPKNMAVQSVAVYSSLGQLIHRFNEEDDDARIVKSLNNLSQGAYLVKVSTEQGVVAKMIVVN
ncbi:LamG-like jellyroll fold domain-containing protein [Pseudotamlana agarivorans]|uniref:LamG-like jellyroll fold domain-containing protein n=1 Tax=Pseudotamlana agarivorans TaxID=481183 RepID=UPI000834CC80|nr:LamG-like jellyroll fold domain-containing protein [Tamlana agarivorans]